jgi:5'-3' exonuclease
MIPGMHYNWRRKDLYETNKYASEFNFWKQMIVGDSTDNVQGIRGLGEKKATQILQQLEPYEWPEHVQDLYNSHDLCFDLNYNLLRIWTKPYQLYYEGKDHTMLSKEEFLKKLQELKAEFAALLPQDVNEVNSESPSDEA